MGYHTKEIKKGILGEWSKIVEETEELEDAYLQDAKLLIFCELSDLMGACILYCKNYNIPLEHIFNIDSIEAHEENYINTISLLVSSKEKYLYDNSVEIILSVMYCINEYAKQFNLTYVDFLKFSQMTSSAFLENKR